MDFVLKSILNVKFQETERRKYWVFVGNDELFSWREKELREKTADVSELMLMLMLIEKCQCLVEQEPAYIDHEALQFPSQNSALHLFWGIIWMRSKIVRVDETEHSIRIAVEL